MDEVAVNEIDIDAMGGKGIDEDDDNGDDNVVGDDDRVEDIDVDAREGECNEGGCGLITRCTYVPPHQLRPT